MRQIGINVQNKTLTFVASATSSENKYIDVRSSEIEFLKETIQKYFLRLYITISVIICIIYFMLTIKDIKNVMTDMIKGHLWPDSLR